MPPPEAIAGTYKDAGGKTIKVPPLSDEDKLALVRWIDIGCPIDLDYDAKNPNRRGNGWMLDEGRPTLTVASPKSGENAEPLSAILVGMHDYDTGLNLDSFRVTADFAIDGAPAGENLAGRFNRVPGHRWELKLKTPITTLPGGTLTVSIEDRQGNVSRIDRKFSITPNP
jgi:hypothetical protein